MILALISVSGPDREPTVLRHILMLLGEVSAPWYHAPLEAHLALQSSWPLLPSDIASLDPLPTATLENLITRSC